MKKNLHRTQRIGAGVVGVCAILFASGGGFIPEISKALAGGLSLVETPAEQDHLSNAPNEKSTPPVIPPTHDSEMVVKPEVPLDPDAVVTPPVVDPEMAVDPATGERLTEEKLERLTPDKLEKDLPDQEGIPDK